MNKQQTEVEQFAIALYVGGYLRGNGDEIQELLDKYKAIDKEETIKFALYYTYGQYNVPEETRMNIEKLYNKVYGGGNK
jgi:hypothetical protein